MATPDGSRSSTPGCILLLTVLCFPGAFIAAVVWPDQTAEQWFRHTVYLTIALIGAAGVVLLLGWSRRR